MVGNRLSIRTSYDPASNNPNYPFKLIHAAKVSPSVLKKHLSFKMDDNGSYYVPSDFIPISIFTGFLQFRSLNNLGLRVYLELLLRFLTTVHL